VIYYWIGLPCEVLIKELYTVVFRINSKYRGSKCISCSLSNLHIRTILIWGLGNCRILYTNIDLKLRNKLHGPMHCKKVIHVYTMETCMLYTRQSNPPISQFNSPFNEFTSVWSMVVYTTRFTQ